MAHTSIRVLDSDEEQDTRQTARTVATNKPKGPGQKRARSKSPPKQSKKSKTRSGSQDRAPKSASKSTTKSSSTKSSSTKSSSTKLRTSTPNSALTSEQRSAKNAATRLSTKEKRQAAPPKKELAASIMRIEKTKSTAYRTFELPVLKKPAAKGAPYQYHSFTCKTCREAIVREIGDGSTSALLKHQRACELKKAQGTLAEYGITGRRAPPTAYEVREYVALWVCEDGRPFSVITDRYLLKLIPGETVKMLPHRSCIPKDIATMYQMAQKSIKTMLTNLIGAFHIGLDMYQSANGFDYLGVVLFYTKVADKAISLERFVLECLSFSGRHTGAALAKVVYEILCNFGIKDRVWGVVCDNASNNADMMKRFKGFKMERLTGPTERVHCLPHVLNLASKAIALPFLQTRAQLEKNQRQSSAEQTNNLRDLFDDDAPDDLPEPMSDDEDIDLTAEDETGEDDGTAQSRSLDADDEPDEDLDDIFVAPMIPGSPEAKELSVAKLGLFKIAWLARKLRFSSNQFRADFQLICKEKNLPTPWNVRRDVRTRWNSTKEMVDDVLRLEMALVKFQKTEHVPRKKQITTEELRAMELLLRLLRPLSTLTEIMSKSGVPMIADVLVHFDALNREYCTMANDKNLPLWGQHAANRGRLKLDKYYRATDTSNLYSMGALLHPSLRMPYLEKAKWEVEWKDRARQITFDCWNQYYKPDNYGTTEDTTSQTNFGYSSYLDEVFDSIAEEQDRPLDPVSNFIKGNIITDYTKTGKRIPVNAITWWHTQRLAGDEHDGLTQMAIDVLSTPASSVEVERAFSFVSALVSRRRHKMAAYTIQSSATLGAYSRANLVPPGMLAKANKKEREQAKARARAKVTEAQAQAAAAEAEALAAEVSQSEEEAEAEEEAEEEEEEEVEEDEDDEDVLEPSSDAGDIDEDLFRDD